MGKGGNTITMYNDREYIAKNISGAGTFDIFQGKGVLGGVVLNAIGTGGTVTLTDMTSPNITIATITLGTSPSSVPISVDYYVSIANSLRVVTSASPNITITWSK